MFKGRLYGCTDVSKKVKEDCQGEYITYEDNTFDKPKVEERVWENYDFNYDTVHEAMLSLFVVATFEGWPPLLYKYVYSYSFQELFLYIEADYWPLNY